MVINTLFLSSSTYVHVFSYPFGNVFFIIQIETLKQYYQSQSFKCLSLVNFSIDIALLLLCREKLIAYFPWR